MTPFSKDRLLGVRSCSCESCRLVVLCKCELHWLAISCFAYNNATRSDSEARGLLAPSSKEDRLPVLAWKGCMSTMRSQWK